MTHFYQTFVLVKDRVDKEEFIIEYFPTEFMLEYFFTNPLQGNLSKKRIDFIIRRDHVDTTEDIISSQPKNALKQVSGEDGKKRNGENDTYRKTWKKETGSKKYQIR